MTVEDRNSIIATAIIVGIDIAIALIIAHSVASR